MQGDVLRAHKATLVEVILCRLRAFDIPEQKDTVSADVFDAAEFLEPSVACIRIMNKANLLLSFMHH